MGGFMSAPPNVGNLGTASQSRAPLREDDGRLARGRKSRAKIRAAARTLFRDRGFDGATLRAIAAEAGMGASSIYRHVQSKEELLIEELSEMQEEAWTQFRKNDDRNRSTLVRLREFLDIQHELLVQDRDLTTIALRATTKTEARVSRRVLQLYDRTIGLLMEILQHGRMKKMLAKEVDVLEAARTLFYVTNGARIPWANGMVSDDACRTSVHAALDMIFQGIGAAPQLSATGQLSATEQSAVTERQALTEPRNPASDRSDAREGRAPHSAARPGPSVG